MAMYLNIFLIVGALIGSGICENHNQIVLNTELPEPSSGLELDSDCQNIQRDSACQRWANNGDCQKTYQASRASWMKTNCKKACNLCTVTYGGGCIAGIVVGGICIKWIVVGIVAIVAILVVIIFVVACCKCRKREKKMNKYKSDKNETPEQIDLINSEFLVPKEKNDNRSRDIAEKYEDKNNYIDILPNSNSTKIDLLDSEFLVLKENNDNCSRDIAEKYEALPNSNSAKIDQLKSEFAELKEINCNRSKDIDDDTLVKLKKVDYVNASYILDKKFIVTPDPMPDQDHDLWQLIYESDIRVVIRISTEGDQKPMAQYIPDEIGVRWIMGAEEVEITLENSQQRDGHMENTLKLNKKGESREIKHLHLTNWAESSIQDQQDQAKVLRLISTGRSFSKKIENKPILIHCGDGSVRTGTVAGIWHLMDQYDQGYTVNTAGCVESLRKDRMSMVQNQEEYIFMDYCIMEYIRNSKIYRRNEN